MPDNGIGLYSVCHIFNFSQSSVDEVERIWGEIESFIKTEATLSSPFV